MSEDKDLDVKPPEKKSEAEVKSDIATKYGDSISKHAGAVTKELVTAMSKWKPFNNYHEAYGKLKEEVDEFWDDVKADNLEGAKKEIVQVAAMALRTLVELENYKVEDDKL